jgi:prepilin peptidase CpaA
MEVLPACALLVASLAAVIDVGSRRIPNWLTFGALVSGVLINAWLHGIDGALSALAGAVLGGAMLLPFYAIRAMGAGDVKLLAALGALLGAQAIVSVAIYGALVGGAMSLVILAIRGYLPVTLRDLAAGRLALSPSGAKAPYGVAIAAGVYLSMLLPGVLG